MNAFIELIKKCNSDEEMVLLMEDSFTPAEFEMIEERFHILYQLHQGLTQRDVKDKLKVSISTVTRASRVLKYGTGIFKKLVVRTDYFKENSFVRKQD
jgi:Trp operon repressor